MTSKARQGSTNKKTAAARAEAHDKRLLVQAVLEAAEGGVPPGPEQRARIVLSAGDAKAARQYLDELLGQAYGLVVDSLPKTVGELRREQLPALHALDVIAEAREGIRLLGGAS
jgi:hypothetical protein